MTDPRRIDASVCWGRNWRNEILFNIRVTLGATTLIAVHLAVRTWAAEVHDVRRDIVGAAAVACVCSYWLAVRKAPYAQIHIVSFVASLFSAAATTAEIALAYGRAGVSITHSGSHVVLFLVCLIVATLVAGVLGTVVRAFLNYVHPPLPCIRRAGG